MAGTWLLGFAGVRPGRSGSCSYLVLVAHAVQCASSRDSERPAWRVGLSTISYSILSVYPHPTLQGRREREREREDILDYSFLLFFFSSSFPLHLLLVVRRGSTNGSWYSCRLVGTCGCATASSMCDERTSLNPTQRNATKRNARQRSPIPIPPPPPHPVFSRVARRAGG